MPARTIKGEMFTIVVDGKRITVKHVPIKGKRCRVFVPPGVTIESGQGGSTKTGNSKPDATAGGNSPTS